MPLSSGKLRFLKLITPVLLIKSILLNKMKTICNEFQLESYHQNRRIKKISYLKNVYYHGG